jgi:zinc/manganese transport system substrate-binding protein
MLLAGALLLLAGCGATSSGSSSGGITVVAAENFWGAIATELAGTQANVQSIIANPAQDPHSYEPTPADARTLATARLVIENGIGYDPWVQRLIAANPTAGRDVLTVGSLLGLAQGDNPHRWYSPADVEAVASAITAELQKLDPKHSADFAANLRTFEGTDLAQYHALIAAIKARYAGVPVGASESIFALQAPALGLDLTTPYSFMNAISEGTEVTAQDTATVQRQIANHEIKVWIYNSQNATPGIQHLNAQAQAQGIPIVTITETLTPPGDTFEHWQVGQLERIAVALHEATGR